MDRRAFYKHFEKLAASYSFGIDADGQIRGRAPNGTLCCPLMAVAYELTGLDFNEDDFIVAAEEIGLSEENAWAIVAASDYDWYPPTDMHEHWRVKVRGALEKRVAHHC